MVFNRSMTLEDIDVGDLFIVETGADSPMILLSKSRDSVLNDMVRYQTFCHCHGFLSNDVPSHRSVFIALSRFSECIRKID